MMSNENFEKLSIPACRAFHKVAQSGINENMFILFGG